MVSEQQQFHAKASHRSKHEEGFPSALNVRKVTLENPPLHQMGQKKLFSKSPIFLLE